MSIDEFHNSLDRLKKNVIPDPLVAASFIPQKMSNEYKVTSFVFKVILNEGITIRQLLDHLPIINTDKSFVLIPTVFIKGEYTVVIVNGRGSNESSLHDGISFHNSTTTSTVNTFYNKHTTGLEIVQFGWIPLSRAGYQFFKVNIVLPDDKPRISSQTNFNFIFYSCEDRGVPLPISSWDVSNVISMSNAFDGRTTFNTNISSWDVSNVVDMTFMFNNCTSFNQPLQWNVSNVVDMSNLFNNCRSFNQPLLWDVSKVTNMALLFFGCKSFNQNISSWMVYNVTTMDYMFYNCSSLVVNLSSWPTTATHYEFNKGAPTVTPPIWG
jgi:surface protein